MIVDSSALIAVLRREPEAAKFRSLLLSARPARISAATYLEISIVVDGYREPILSRRIDEIIEEFEISIEPVTVEQARIARQAYRDFGKGSGHAANLNFGDCFSYALARVNREPLLFKGDDFGHTDLRSALR